MPEEKNIENPLPKIETSINDLRELIEKNIKWSQANYELEKKINRSLNLMVWGGIFKWIIILGPIILGIIFLPSLLKPYWDQYSGLLNGLSNGMTKTTQNNVLGNVSSSQLQEVMKLLGK